MKLISHSEVQGVISAPPSKSSMQRAIAASVLSDGTSVIRNPSFCSDCTASLSIAESLGAEVKLEIAQVVVRGGLEFKSGLINCGESGLAMRMFTPIAALLDERITLTGTGSLLKRPMGILEEPLRALGAECSTNSGLPPIVVKGPLKGGRISIDGSISSQALTGLLLALPAVEADSKISVRELKSSQYVMMTLEVMRDFRVEAQYNGGLSEFLVPGGQRYEPCDFTVEGDWSGAAFILVAGAIAGRVEVEGLNLKSLQPDIAIMDALSRAGAELNKMGRFVVEKGELHGFDFDATDCPDLFPPLVALAANCRGKTVLKGASRLVHKESNRAQALISEFRKMGANIELAGDQIVIVGSQLRGAEVDSHGDHRIAMACAVAGLSAGGRTKIIGDECVSKSYPNFFADIEKLTGEML